MDGRSRREALGSSDSSLNLAGHGPSCHVSSFAMATSKRFHGGTVQRRMRLVIVKSCSGSSKPCPVQSQARVTADPRPDFAKGHKTPGLSKDDRTVDGLTRALVGSEGGLVTWCEAVLWPSPLGRSLAAFPDLSACPSQVTLLPAPAGSTKES